MDGLLEIPERWEYGEEIFHPHPPEEKMPDRGMPHTLYCSNLSLMMPEELQCSHP